MQMNVQKERMPAVEMQHVSTVMLATNVCAMLVIRVMDSHVLVSYLSVSLSVMVSIDLVNIVPKSILFCWID